MVVSKREFALFRQAQLHYTTTNLLALVAMSNVKVVGVELESTSSCCNVKGTPTAKGFVPNTPEAP